MDFQISALRLQAPSSSLAREYSLAAGAPRYLSVQPCELLTFNSRHTRFKMLFSTSIARAIALAVTLTASVTTATFHSSYKGPKDCDEFRKHHPYHPSPSHRRKIYIRPSYSDTDDVSKEFYEGLKKANHGGTLVLPKNHTFVIGQKLDLTFLNDIEVNLEGKILVSITFLLLSSEV